MKATPAPKNAAPAAIPIRLHQSGVQRPMVVTLSGRDEPNAALDVLNVVIEPGDHLQSQALPIFELGKPGRMFNLARREGPQFLTNSDQMLQHNVVAVGHIAYS